MNYCCRNRLNGLRLVLYYFLFYHQKVQKQGDHLRFKSAVVLLKPSLSILDRPVFAFASALKDSCIVSVLRYYTLRFGPCGCPPVHASALVNVMRPCDGLSHQVMAAPSGALLSSFAWGCIRFCFARRWLVQVTATETFWERRCRDTNRLGYFPKSNALAGAHHRDGQSCTPPSESLTTPYKLWNGLVVRLRRRQLQPSSEKNYEREFGGHSLMRMRSIR